VLHDVSATIRAGSVVGIVGPSGSGKSTLVQLLLGLRQPTRGQVLSRGRPIDGLSRATWARKVTFVPQSSHLITGSVADNIRFMRVDVSDHAVEAAARLAHLHDEICEMAGGYQHELGGSAGTLSGGQVQRLSIARALIEHPDVLILDEPTSSLDVRSESLIRQTLSSLRSQMTIIVIAHRMSTLEICDEIMVIQAGRVVAQGPPASLEVSNEFYREALELSGLR
jgi:ATP-binding cassette subfamily B protein